MFCEVCDRLTFSEILESKAVGDQSWGGSFNVLLSCLVLRDGLK